MAAQWVNNTLDTLGQMALGTYDTLANIGVSLNMFGGSRRRHHHHNLCNSRSLLGKNYGYIFDTLQRNIGEVDYVQHINHIDSGILGVNDTQIGDAICIDYNNRSGYKRFHFLSDRRWNYSNYFNYAQLLNPYVGYSVIDNSFGGFDIYDDILKVDNDIEVNIGDNEDLLTRISDKYNLLVDTEMSFKLSDDKSYQVNIKGDYKIPHQITSGYTFNGFKEMTLTPQPSISEHRYDIDANVGSEYGDLTFDTEANFGSNLLFAMENNEMVGMAEAIRSNFNIKGTYGKLFNSGKIGHDSIYKVNSIDYTVSLFEDELLPSFYNKKNESKYEVRYNNLSSDFSKSINAKTLYTYAESQYKDSEKQINNTTDSSIRIKLGVNNTHITSFDSNGGSLSSTIDDLIGFTNRNFAHGKYKTIVSRFGSYAEGPSSNEVEEDEYTEYHTAVSTYGTSHGRNLLRKEGARNVRHGGSQDYNDPYCRVWTHYHQYSRVNNLIRPFMESKDGDTAEIISANTLYNTYGFNKIRTKQRGDFENGQERLAKHGVLSSNGFVNITPKNYDKAEDQIKRTKQCMFALENLAWKGCTNSLSKEQKGPLGGRIMWFPPYDLKFSENISTPWSATDFIGRGEKIYTYTDTERTGQLSFKLLIDHPSIVNYYRDDKDGEDDDMNQTGKEYDILRFFAGCGLPIPSKIDDVPNTEIPNDIPLDEINNDDLEPDIDYNPKKDEDEVNLNEEEPTPLPSTEEITFMVFFPNNYTGAYEDPINGVDPMVYLINGVGAQMSSLHSQPNKRVDIKTDDTVVTYGSFEGLYGYEMNISNEHGITPLDVINSTQERIESDTDKTTKGHPCSGVPLMTVTSGVIEYDLVPLRNTKHSTDWDWWYRVDRRTTGSGEPVSGQWLRFNIQNHKDIASYGLNSSKGIDNIISNASLYNLSDDDIKDHLYSFSEIFVAFYERFKNGTKLTQTLSAEYCDSTRLEELRKKLEQYKIVSVLSEGFASAHGRSTALNKVSKSNEVLMNDRATSIKKWIERLTQDTSIVFDTNIVNQTTNEINTTVQTSGNERRTSELEAKMGRCAKVTIKLSKETTEDLKDTIESDGETNIKYEPIGTSLTGDNELNEVVFVAERPKVELAKDSNERYDNEYRFFKEIAINDSFFRHKIKEKIQYFDPAFHSISPEGFNARLTFLQQCMRQGPTIGNSDAVNSKTANNLAFGRQPICVLRLGDFYYTKVAIESMSIDYENLWDLNPEGIGVQPMIANVSLSFKFLGGSDIEGPINRLQNAVSFNYYANTSIYDNRAEMIRYNNSEDNHDPISYHGVNLGKDIKI